ncbi:MAG: sulfatase-like hydrolase/transferase [Clostridia bacterium]|nr:sulfatase-like hydrolase/transferase [Clostridia bacterium]
MNKPNIIILMTDQQRADLRKGWGYPLDTMPFLDQFAAEGVDFGRAYTPNPTCMPARVSMFTGRYASAHRVRTNHNAKDALYTQDLLDVLKGAGYRTAICGKNHSHRSPEEFDFHETSGHLGYEGEENSTPAEKEFADFLRATKHMETHIPSPGGLEVQHPYRNVSSALKFIDSCPKDQPFFAWVSFAEPHNPSQVPEPYFDMFPPESLPPTNFGPEILAEKGPRWTWLRGVWEGVMGDAVKERILRTRSNYHGMLRLIDDQFRRLIEGLEERGLRQNTLVIYVSDHGDFVGEYGLVRKGVDLPEILTHVPMIVQGPGIATQGLRQDVCVNIIDILPTICDLIGTDTPLGVQGKSMLPLLRGENVPAGEFDIGYSESGFSGLYWDKEDALTLDAEGAADKDLTRFDCLNTWTQSGQVRAVRKGDWKLQCDMQGSVYLYNLAEDPFEGSNLANDPACADKKADMLMELIAATLRAEDILPFPHYRYRTKLHPRGYWRDESYHSPDIGVRDLSPLGRPKD